MKKIIFAVIVGLLINLTLSAKATATESNYYITSTGQLTHCKRITFRTNEIKVVLEDGERLLIPMTQIKTIKVRGKIYDKLPVFKNNQPTNKEMFMELVTTKDGLKLYKYHADIDFDRRENGFNLDGYQMENYVVFKDGQYHAEVTDANYPAMFSFFELNYTNK